MSEFTRATRQCTLASMRPDLAAAILAHIERHELGALAGEALICLETTSIKPKKGLFGREVTILTGVLLTPQWLVWAFSKNGEEPAAISGRLRNLEIQDYEKTEMYRFMQDSGLQVLGQYTGMVERGSTFIGLGPELVTAEFRRILKDALQKANA